jgi:hypothetical protein
VVNLAPFSATTGVLSNGIFNTFPTPVFGQQALGALLSPGLQANGIFVGNVSILTPAGRAAFERLIIGEMVKANVANILLGSLALQRGSTQEVRNVGVQLVNLGIAGLTTLQPLLRPFNIQINFTRSDIQTLNNLGVQPGSVFDQQFANLLAFQNQRFSTIQTFFFIL